MKSKKQKLLDNAMKDFHKHDGGTAVDPEYTTKDPEALKAGLQKSFDSIFPELMKKAKHRKHVIFDDDVLTFFEKLKNEKGVGFSPLINSALRTFIRDHTEDPEKKLG